MSDMENDALYREGLQHFGMAEWSEAVACFSRLQESYPDDPRVSQFLESARLRATMGSGLRRGARSATRAKWLGRLSRLAMVLILVVIASMVYLAYQTWAVPAQAEAERLSRIDQLRQTAQSQIASGQYAAAAASFEGILAEIPDDASASAGLIYAQQLEKAASLYAQATAALDAGDEAEAMRLLQEIRAIDPDYRNASSLIDEIRSAQAMNKAYEDALKLYQSSDWQGAAQAFETIRTTDPDFQPQDVKDKLFAIYLRLAEQQIDQADSIAEVEVADSLYQKALTVRPLDPRADGARRLAETFLEGAQAYQIKDWETIIRKLGVVHEQQPGYYGGKVAEWLFEAFVTTGDDFMGQGDPFSARDRFAEALRVAPGDEQRAEAQKRYDTANRLTTPTPTRRPSPTPQPPGYVPPAWTRRVTGTPDPYPFALINVTYLPNTITGEGCKWAGVAGRIFDRQGAPLTAETLGVRVTGPVDKGVAAGAHKIVGESGWILQFDVRAKVITGYIQVYYKDQPASQLIPFATRNSCYENMMIVDIQQMRALP